MSIIAIVLIVLVALLHLYFLVLEMFLWTKPLGLKVFAPIAREGGTVEGAGREPGALQRLPCRRAAVGGGDGAAAGGAVLPRLRGGRRRLWRDDGQPKIFFVQALPALAAIAALLLLK